MRFRVVDQVEVHRLGQSEDKKYQKQVEHRYQLIQTLLVISGILIVFPSVNLSNPKSNMLNIAFTGFFLSAIFYIITINGNMYYYLNPIFDKVEAYFLTTYNLNYKERSSSFKKGLGSDQINIFCYSALQCANFFSIIFLEFGSAFENPFMKYLKNPIYILTIFIIFMFLLEPKFFKLNRKKLIYLLLYELLFIYLSIFYISGLS